MATEPKIYMPNYLDAYSVFTPSSGSSKLPRLYDRDRDVQWSSSGQGTNGTGASIIAQFSGGGGSPTARTVDTLIFLNHNLVDMTIASSADGVNYSNQLVTTGSGNNLFSITPVTAAFWRIYSENTSPSNQEKAIGEWILTSLLLDPGVDLDGYDVNYRQMAPEIQLADGSIHRTVIKWTESRSAKYEFTGKMSYLTITQLETLRVLKESGAPFLWQPESITRPQEIYLVNWTGQFHFRYISTYKGAGYQVDFQFKEV